MTKMTSRDAAAIIIVGLLASVVCSSAAAMADGELAMDAGDLLQVEQQGQCPQAAGIVKPMVDAEFRRNPQITAGFLRVFFHDCMTDGCDASILLNGEWDAGVNTGSVQDRVRDLVEEIRAKVHAVCPRVSCADILALATRDSVVAAKGPSIPVALGRKDSSVPASTAGLPGPNQPIQSLLDLFKGKGLDQAADLVALSGGHTVGRTKICQIVRQQFQGTCNANRGTQVLDVITPNEFDNKYFEALTRNQGVFQSDQGLLGHPATKDLVTRFAGDKDAFFKQFVTSMLKLGNLKGKAAGNGGVRGNCKIGKLKQAENVDEQGFAASA